MFLTEVHPEYRSPVYAIVIVYLVSTVFLLLPLVSTSAFSSLCGMASIGLQISYCIPIAIKLFFTDRDSFPFGPVNFGDWSIIFEVISLLWLLSSSILMCFPYTYPVSYSNMNYNVLIVGVVVILFELWWRFELIDSFAGPKRYRGAPISNENDNSSQSNGNGNGSGRVPNIYEDSDFDAIVSENTALLGPSGGPSNHQLDHKPIRKPSPLVNKTE